MSKDEQGYSGWKNYETWNVALYIQNDYGLYCMAKGFTSYEEFRDELRELGIIETPDQVSYNDSGLDIRELDEMLKGLHE